VISALDIAVVILGALFAAAYSGSEIGFYSVSRARIDVEARQGIRRSRIVRRLLADDMAFLIVVLIGSNLMFELITWSAEDLMRAARVPDWALHAAVPLVLAPLLFFFCEVLPKDLFRRRPHAFLAGTAPLVLVSRWLFWPLERLLVLLTYLLDRILRLEPRLLSAVRGREAVLRLLSESAKEGAILPHAELMARNVLKLRSTTVERCMIAWSGVRTLRSDASQAELYEAVQHAPHTRIPVVDPAGTVLGYVHQLDVLGEGEETPVMDQLRPVTVLASGISVDRALARLRSGGQRLAVVGEAGAPRGIVTLKDLLEEISGDLAGW
jgi:CBS domain containing-hemolysin-like protein